MWGSYFLGLSRRVLLLLLLPLLLLLLLLPPLCSLTRHLHSPLIIKRTLTHSVSRTHQLSSLTPLITHQSSSLIALNATKRPLQSALLEAARASGRPPSGRLQTPLNALSRVLCWMPRARFGAAALRKTLNATKRPVQSALLQAVRASGRPPPGRL